MLAVPGLSKLIDDLKKDANSHPSNNLDGHRLYYKGRFVGFKFCLDTQIITGIYTTPTGGHSGVYCMYRRLAQNLF